MDTSNKFLVTSAPLDRVAILKPPTRALSVDEALNLAANLVAIAAVTSPDPVATVNRFTELLKAVAET